MIILRGIVTVMVLAWHVPALAGELFEKVAHTLTERFYDSAFREGTLPKLIEQFKPAADAAADVAAERAVINAFLAEIPASHLALISEDAYRSMFGHLMNQETPAIGFELIEIDDMQFVHALLEGGPAARAGVLPGDRVVAINGAGPLESGRLDWSTDDAALPDPPIRALNVEDGETITLTIERTPGQMQEIAVTIAPYSAYAAAKASVRVIDREKLAIGYIHFHYIHIRGVDTLLADTLNGAFSECDAVVIDLRGRGGSAAMVGQVIELLTSLKAKRGTAILAIIDQNTRSAKEAIAWELRDRSLAVLVGETTAGALLPATFTSVGDNAVLMYPSFKLPKYSDAIEGVGVEPHVPVEPIRAYTNGDDPLIERAIAHAVKEVQRAAGSDL